MSAFQDLMTALVARHSDQSAAEDERIILAALAKHARELAQQQRATANGWAGDGYAAEADGLREGADLIDSNTEVQR